MKNWFWAGAVLFAFSACSNNATQSASGETEVDSIATADEDVLAATFTFPQFYAALDSQDAAFDPTLFQETEGGTLPQMDSRFFPPEELQPFLPYLIYNSDSSLALDLFSYNYILQSKAGQTTLEAAGPDTEVAVVRMKNNERTRIFFSGPGTTIRYGKWINDSTVLLGGAAIIDQDKMQPLLLRIDLTQNSLQRYTYPDTLQAQFN